MMGWASATQRDESVFWHWICPTHPVGQRGTRVQYVKTDVGHVPVCMDCGNSGPVRDGPLYEGPPGRPDPRVLRKSLDENGNPYR